MRRCFVLMLCGQLCLMTIVTGQEPTAEGEKTDKPAKKNDGAPGRTDPKAASGQSTSTLTIDSSWSRTLNWRPIGPASMGGRIVDLAVVESDPSTFYVATASGGIFKTINNGTTFTAIFEKQNSASIGDVCVSASDPNTIWAGTGEHNARNSVSWGDGVYKSIDGGKTWKNMGLTKSFQIGRIAIHPTNPEIVYVAALGRLWGPNEERGVFKTTDGGKTWEKVLYVDDKTGAVDIAMHPENSDTLIAAMYERQRDAFDGHDPTKRWGPGSGLFKSIDGGATWNKLTKGLPNRPLGRIGVVYYRNDPTTVYAIVESDKIGTGPASAYMGITGSDPRQGTVIQRVIKDGPAAKAGLEDGDRVLEIDDDKIDSYNKLILKLRDHKPGEKSKLKIKRGDDEKTLEIIWGKRPGEASSRPFTSYLGGQRANAQGKQGENEVDTGGIYKSTDGGESWERINSLNPRPFYYSQVHIDPSDDCNIFVLGVQLHQSTDGGATFKTTGRRVHPDHHAMWIDPRDGRHLILGCDGGLYTSYDGGVTWDFHNIMDIGQFYDVGVDTRKPYWVYGGLQDNGSWGGPSRKRGALGPLNSDWVRVGGGDGFVCRVDPNDPDLVYCEMQGGRIWRFNRRTGARTTLRAPTEKGTENRFNWKTPFLLSHHNSKIFYCAGNFVFQSLDRGNDLRRISPKISRTDRGNATALSESPRDSNVLYAGTDDGALWVTRNGGNEWTDISANVDLPGSFHVSSIEASRFERGRAYVAFDGHRSNNDDPHVYVTEDYGKTWKSLNANLPVGSTRVLREDVENPDLLYVGTEFAIWASLDRGNSWSKINNNLPTVAIHEIAVHPTQGELVVGTHGRSAWILDVTPLRQMTKDVASAKAHLFKPASGVLWSGALYSSRSGHRNFTGQNPSFGSSIHYCLSEDAKKVSLEILDIKGDVIRRLKTNNKAGVHLVQWDLRGVIQPRPTPDKPPAHSQNPEPFDRLDSNKDGKLTVADVAEKLREQFVRRFITPADGDKDGSVTAEEYKKLVEQRSKQLRDTPPSRPQLGPPVKPGTYLVKLSVDDRQFSHEIQVDADPEFPAALLLEELEEFHRKERAEQIE